MDTQPIAVYLELFLALRNALKGNASGQFHEVIEGPIDLAGGAPPRLGIEVLSIEGQDNIDGRISKEMTLKIRASFGVPQVIAGILGFSTTSIPALKTIARIEDFIESWVSGENGVIGIKFTDWSISVPGGGDKVSDAGYVDGLCKLEMKVARGNNNVAPIIDSITFNTQAETITVQWSDPVTLDGTVGNGELTFCDGTNAWASNGNATMEGSTRAVFNMAIVGGCSGSPLASFTNAAEAIVRASTDDPIASFTNEAVTIE